jgi:hypothetical protein
MEALTMFTFSAQASDPDGDAITYQWRIYADGSTHNGQTLQGAYGNGGNFSANVTVTDSRGMTSTQTTNIVSVRSMDGQWVGIQYPAVLGQFFFSLSQTGAVVTGSYRDVFYGDGILDPAEPGRVDANGNFTIRVKQAKFCDWYFIGTLDPTGRRASGTLKDCGFNGQPFVMDKQ